MKMINTLTAIAFTIVFIAGCAGNPEQKANSQGMDTSVEQLSGEQVAPVDSVVVEIDSAQKAIEESSKELDQLLNEL